LYIMRRTQIYLDESDTQELDARAVTEGVTRSMLIRRAVDEYLRRGDQDPAVWRERWQEAVRETAGAAPRLDDGAVYVERLRATDARRLSELA
jgi:hypothetical protein